METEVPSGNEAVFCRSIESCDWFLHDWSARLIPPNIVLTGKGLLVFPPPGFLSWFSTTDHCPRTGEAVVPVVVAIGHMIYAMVQLGLIIVLDS